MADTSSTSQVPGPTDPTLMQTGLRDARAKVHELEAQLLAAQTALEGPAGSGAASRHVALAAQLHREVQVFFQGDAPAHPDIETVDDANEQLAIEAKTLAAGLLNLASGIAGIVRASMDPADGESEGLNVDGREDLRLLVQLAEQATKIGADAESARFRGHA